MSSAVLSGGCSAVIVQVLEADAKSDGKFHVLARQSTGRRPTVTLIDVCALAERGAGMMNSQEIDPITELKQRGGGLRARPVRFDIDGLHEDIGEGEPAATLSMSQGALVRLLRKETDSTTLFMTGDLKITGDMSAAVAFGQASKEAPRVR